MALSYLFDPNNQFQNKAGENNVFGHLEVFIDYTDDHAPTYCNFTGTLNPERIVLDNNGRAVVIVDELKTYRIEVYDRTGNLLWSQYPVRPTNVIYGDYNVYNADINGTPDEIDVDVETSASGVKKFTIKLANAVKTVIGNIQDTISSIVESVSTKADKVQGATVGNLASLDASGNITDSGSKVADFKTKQTAVTDPTTDGFGLSFIDSITQNANGEITPHKKTVQDCTTMQKGVVQLQDSVGSSESVTDKAVTPHAVRAAIDAAVSSAYHAAGTKTVAQLTGSLLIAENEGCVYNVTDSGTTTPDFVDGAGRPINAGDNVGVCDVGGGVYKFDLLSGFVDLSNYLTKTGDASNTTATFTKNASDTSAMISGSKLSVIFTAISSFFASVLSALGGKADKVNITGATKIKITYNSQGIVTSGENLDASDIPTSLPAVTAGIAPRQFPYRNGTTTIGGSTYRTVIIGNQEWLNSDLQYNDSGTGIVTATEGTYIGNLYYNWEAAKRVSASVGNGWRLPTIDDVNTLFDCVGRSIAGALLKSTAGWGNSSSYNGKNSYGLDIWPTGRTISGANSNQGWNAYYWTSNSREGAGESFRFAAVEVSAPGFYLENTYCQSIRLVRNTSSNISDLPAVGSASLPVYVDSDGSVKPCGFSVNFGTPIAGANVLNIITA